MKRAMCVLLALLCALPLSCAAETDASDWRYGNWYEVFVRSFKDSDGDGIGDLQGLIAKLDYIENLGFTGIWLMPVMPSPSYHKYDVTDYMAVDPQYGTMDDMRALVSACHARGIRLIIDMPINHTSIRHPWFLSACEAIQRRKTDHPYIQYYNFSEQMKPNTVKVSGANMYYEEQFAGGGMPDLNLDSDAVFAEIEAIFAFWLTDVGVDGFRLDAVTSYFTGNLPKNVAFLQKLNAMAKALRPDAYIVGEAWTGLAEIASYYESGIDSFFLFPASQAEGYIAKTIRARSPVSTYKKYLEQTFIAIPNGVLAPFLANHDTGRAIGSLQARASLSRAKFGQGLLNMMGGAVFTYYGEEIGMVGSGADPNKRLAMYWNDSDMTLQPPGTTQIEYAYPSVDEQLADDASLLHYVRRLNEAKLRHPAVARGATEFVYEDKNLLVMKRVCAGDEALILINFSAAATSEYTYEGVFFESVSLLDATDAPSAFAYTDDGTVFTIAPQSIIIAGK